LNIVYLCHYFHPEIGAPSARGLEMARVWRDAGHTVKVVTCFPNHPTGIIPEAYRGKRFMIEEFEGLTIYRNFVYATPNEGFIKKTLGHLSFMASSVLQSLPRIGEVDVIVVSSPTFFSVISAYVFSLVKRRPFVFDVRDLWPAVFVDLGVLKNRAIIRTLEALEMFLYHRAARVVLVTDSFRRILAGRGVSEEKLLTITNGVDLDFFTPGPVDAALREEWGLTGKFVVLYIGAHGISQGLETVLEAAELTSDDRDIVYVFVGEGAKKHALQDLAAQKGLENVRFLPGQPKSRMPAFYRSADVCLVPLRNIPLFETFIPSKMFEIMGAARPLVASLAGEAREILEASGAAMLTNPEDAQAIAAALRCLKVSPDLETMGASGRSYVEQHYSRQGLAERYLQMLKTLTRSKEAFEPCEKSS
jgi:glycosyltransferase involved in cell wall biosynthesis